MVGFIRRLRQRLHRPPLTARRVTTTADWIEQFRGIHAICAKKNVFLFVNSAWSSLLFSDIGFFESYDVNQVEEVEWRKLAYSSYLCKLTSLRPSGRVVALTGNSAWDRHFAAQGVQAIALPGNTLSSCKAVSSTAFMRLSRELTEAVSFPYKFSPAWWNSEPTDLEINSLKKGDAFVFPMIWHGRKMDAPAVVLETKQIPAQRNALLFIFETEWTLPAELDLTKLTPPEQEALRIRSARAQPFDGGSIRHEFSFARPQELHHLVVSTAPGFVESVEDAPCYLPLPENGGVRIQGAMRAGRDAYRLTVTSGVEKATALLWRPAEWAGVSVSLNHKPAKVERVDVGGASFLRLAVPRGESRIVVERAKISAEIAGAYRNPALDVWNLLAASFYYRNAQFKTMSEDGHTPCRRFSWNRVPAPRTSKRDLSGWRPRLWAP